MLEYKRRGRESSIPLGEHSVWFSNLLRNRGVDTLEKAERFLHPSLEQLNDPFLFPDMEKAVTLIREAIASQKKILVYGDYDVDGVCATSIMVETLREEGAVVDFRIPSRHGEGYGLNMAAVQEAAKDYQVLVTVDNGITALEEVAEAKRLGMTVIVTDHHEPAERPVPAHAVLNPKLGGYPFRFLCGAGVALKICQALQGMEGVKKRIDLAALATVADVVQLTEENRAIVSEGLKSMENPLRPGIRNLMAVSGLRGNATASDLAFKLAPRINAGGRMEDAATGVHLMLAEDDLAAEKLAQQLDDVNKKRQAIERDILQQCLNVIELEERDESGKLKVDFREDRAIVILGAGWKNGNGIVGLAAGKICERYHYPTIVLSKQEDGTAVGSCRSIPGVNIHAMLTGCKDLFLRFGGHEQAAGLTMEAALVPELRRRLNLLIGENCEPSCFVPVVEYDAELSLRDFDENTMGLLEQLEPTGHGNPAPVFLTRDCHAQEMKTVGALQQHLKMTLMDGNIIKDGIGFSMGNLCGTLGDRVDIISSPSRNEYRGKVTIQMQMASLRTAQGATSLPDPSKFEDGLLQEIALLSSNNNRIPTDVPVERTNSTKVRRLLQTGSQGTLILAHEPSRAARASKWEHLDGAVGDVRDRRGFNTLLCAPDLSRLKDWWHRVVLLDGDVLPKEVAAIKERCPRAEILVMSGNDKLEDLLRSLPKERAEIGAVYRELKRNNCQSLSSLQSALGMTRVQVKAALSLLHAMGVAEVNFAPYSVGLTGAKSDLDKCPMAIYLRGIETHNGTK